jgi:hypothetical protein
VEAKVGDKISIDALKVGQPRRAGVVKELTRGLSGLRYLIRWDDGTQTSFSPKGGNLIIDRRSRSSGPKAKAKAQAKPRPKPAAKAKPRPKPAAKAKPKAAVKASASKKKAASKKGKR